MAVEPPEHDYLGPGPAAIALRRRGPELLADLRLDLVEPIFDHRGKLSAALAFNLVPAALRRDRQLYLVARSASEEASRAFGYVPETKKVSRGR